MLDNRTKYQKLYEELCNTQDDIDAAEAAYIEAKERYKSIWKDHMLSFSNVDDICEKETVLVQDGSFLYRISFDIENFELPQTKRVDTFMSIHKIK